MTFLSTIHFTCNPTMCNPGVTKNIHFSLVEWENQIFGNNLTIRLQTLMNPYWNLVIFIKIFRSLHPASVTRFGENSPLWQVFKVLDNIRVTWFFIGQNFVSTLANFYAIWQVFFVLNGQILNKSSCHLVTLLPAISKMLPTYQSY